MGFCVEENMVRVDFFKESGKWYETVSLKWDRYRTHDNISIELIHDTFRRCCLEQHNRLCQKGWKAVCLEPYHADAYPLMIIFNKE